MISVSNAVVNVGTMVVKPLDTTVTDIAVPAPLGPNDLAVRAQVERIGLVKDILEIDLRVSFDIPRVFEGCKTKEQN